MEKPQLVSIHEVAEVLGVSVMSVRRWWYGGRLPAPVKIASTLRWRSEDIAQWIDAGCRPVDQEEVSK